MMRMWFAAAFCVVLAVACAAGGAKQSKSVAAPESVAAGGAAPSAPHEVDPTPTAAGHSEIQTLADAIERERVEGSFAAPTPIQLQSPATPMAQAPSSTDATCKPAKTERCSSSCKLSDSICSNAKKICDLAKDMIGDDWAAKQCTKANATCETANTTCCNCQ